MVNKKSDKISWAVKLFIGQTEIIQDLKNNSDKKDLVLMNIKRNALEIYEQVQDLELENEFSEIEITLSPIEKIKQCYDSIIFLRQSVKNDNYKARYNFMEKTLTQFSTANNHNAQTVFYQDLSGYWSYRYIMEYLQLPHIKAIYVNEISRLSRNVEGYIFITKYAYENGKEIYLNNTLITEGNGYISGLVQAIFSEFELLSKQNNFSKYLDEVALFLTKKTTLQEIKNPKAKKLCKLARYTDRTQFLSKMNDKAIEVLESDKSKELKATAERVLQIING